MEFIIENQMWFIVGAIVLLMAFIGFIAEKTDFGRKEFEKKIKVVKEPKPKKSKKELKETKEEIIEDVDQIVDNAELEQEEIVLDDDSVVLDEEEIKLDEEPSEDASWGTEDLSTIEAKSDFEEEPELTEITGDVLETSNAEEDLFEPLATETIEEPEVSEETEPLNDDIFAPLTEVEEVTEEPVVTEDLTVPFSIEEEPYKIENEDELPSIDSLGEEESEDDVWKF